MLEPKCITNLKSCLNHYNQDVVDHFLVDEDPNGAYFLLKVTLLDGYTGPFHSRTGGENE